jgi:hypothetical protein
VPYRITFQWNRADQEGFSETYFSNATTTFQQVYQQMQAYVTARQAINGTQVYLYGIRIASVPSNLRLSQFFLNTTANTGLTAPSGTNNVDQGGLGALVTLTGAGGLKQQRVFRGIPDAWMYWEPTLGRMNISPTGVFALNGFVQAMTAGSLGLGWFPRSKAAGNANAFKVTTVTAGTGNTVVIVAPGSTFTNPVSGTLILSGFRKPSSVLNGAYGTGEWVVGSTPATIILTRTVSLDAIAGYQGVGGLVRPYGTGFTPFTVVVNSNPPQWGLVRHRNIGRPFGMVRGRRLVPR